VKMEIYDSISSNNGTGINANGAAVALRIGSSVVTGNTTGATISNGATMSSLGNNMVLANPTPGPRIPIFGPQ